jgi:hypothetical protein
MTNFENIEALNKHLDTCIAAKTLLPFILKLQFSGEARTGHHLSHFIQTIHNSAHLIKQYSMAIANEMSSFERAKIHSNLCDSLDLKYNDFRPFESENITKIPTVEEAENILWNALNKEMLKLSTGIK